MPHEFTDADLESYLDETLHPDLAAELEQCLQEDQSTLQRLSQINGRRDAGVHTLGEIWRRNQIGVPSRELIAEYIDGSLNQDQIDYIDFRVDVLKCRYTIALMSDLENQTSSESDGMTDDRRRKIFDSSAGLLRKQEE